MGALSVLFIAVGAIVAFALNFGSDEVDLTAVGVILMVVGVVGLVASLARGTFMGFRSERHVSDDGRHVVETTRSV